MKKLLLDDFTHYKFLSNFQFSPSATNGAFLCHSVNLEENRYDTSIFTYNLNKDKVSQLVFIGEEDLFLWKNSTTILYSSYQDEKVSRGKKRKENFTPIYEISTEDKKERKVFELPIQANEIKLLNDNTLLVRGLYDPNIKENQHLDLSKQEDKAYEIVDEIPFWSNGKGFTNKKRNRLYIYNIKEDKLKPITDEFTNVNSFEFNKDKSKMVLISNSYIDKEYTSTDLQIYDFDQQRLVKISPMDKFKYIYANFLGDKIIFLGSDMKSYGINENPHFFLVDYEGYIIEQIAEDFNFSTHNSIGSDCRYGKNSTMKVYDNYLYFVTTEGDSSFVNRINIDGKIEKLSFKKGSIDSLDVFRDKVYFIGLRSLRLQEVYSLSDKNEYQITHFNDWVMEEKTLSIPEKLTFKTKEEVLIEGWVMKPIDFRPGKKYPAILNIHGGPKTAYGEIFFHEMQYWANENYLVFFCNPRGSDGRGNVFADIRGRYGRIDYEDIMDFTDLVLEKYPFIDTDRLGVTGGSYGGFMTNWIIGHSSRFKAAVSQRSISNWISKFNTTDIGYYFVNDQLGATPWDNFEKLWEHSPLKYADRVCTPTLFIHSEEDYRCWLPEGIQMFTALKYHGVDARLCIFREENHELSRSGKPKNRIKRLEEITSWFNKHLK